MTRDILDFAVTGVQNESKKMQKLLSRSAMGKPIEFLDLSEEKEYKITGNVIAPLQDGDVIEDKVLRPLIPRNFAAEREKIKQYIEKKKLQVKKAEDIVTDYEKRKIYSKVENAQKILLRQQGDLKTAEKELKELDSIERDYYEDKQTGIQAKIKLLENEIKNLKSQLREIPTK